MFQAFLEIAEQLNKLRNYPLVNGLSWFGKAHREGLAGRRFTIFMFQVIHVAGKPQMTNGYIVLMS